MESGHIKVDQMRKQYDFKIKVFAACNEITRLSRPLQSRFRRLHLSRYTEEQFLEVSAKVLLKLKIAHATAHYIFNRTIIPISMDFFTTTLIYQKISTIHHVYSF